MTPIEIIAAAHLAATLIVGGIHAWMIVLGLRAMRRTSDRRDRTQAAQERAADQRHAEAMKALRELIYGQRDDRRALAELIARTAPSTPAGR